MKVNLFSIGAMRAGSTTIYHYLSQHPEIYMSPIKEPYYFTAEYYRRKIKTNGIKTKSEHAEAKHILNSGKYRTSEKYQSLFEGAENVKYIGEASHYFHQPFTAGIIHEYNPSARIIICIRNPIERIFSEYMLHFRDGKLNIPFVDYIKSGILWNDKLNKWQILSSSRLNKGFYSTLIFPWLRYFGEENVKIMLFEDLVKEPEHALQSVFSWLGVDPTFEPEKIHAQRSGKPVSKKIMRVINNESFIKNYTKKILPSLLRIKMRDHLYKTILKKEKMDERIRDILKIIYSEEVNQLEKMISMDLSTWK